MKATNQELVKTNLGLIFTKYWDNHADRTLVLLHGNSSSSQFWQPIIESKLHQNFNLLTWDLPGHGESPRSEDPSTTYSLPSLATALSQVIQHYAPNQFVLIGHSLGGHIILEAPETLARSQGAVLMGTPPFGLPLRIDLAFQMSPQFLTFMQQGHNPEAVRLAMDSMLQEHNRQKAQLLWQDYVQTDPAFRLHLAQNIQAGKHIDELEVVKISLVPVTLMVARQDQMVNPLYFEHFLPEQDLVYLEDSGHYVFLEEPETLVKVIETRFLTRQIAVC
jgi:pimeloyl-ACP methyl ester carboxylesterase